MPGTLKTETIEKMINQVRREPNGQHASDDINRLKQYQEEVRIGELVPENEEGRTLLMGEADAIIDEAEQVRQREGLPVRPGAKPLKDD